MLIKISKFVLIASLSAFVAAVLLDPSDMILHLKMPLIILTLGVWAVRVACGMVNPGGYKIWAAILLFAFILPGIASIVALLGDTVPIDGPRFQVIKSLSVILVIPVVYSERIDLMKHIIRWSFVIAVFTLVLAVMSLVVPELSAVVFNYGFGKEDVFTHQSLVMGIHSFYYKTVSILVFPLAYYLWNLLNRPNKVINCVLMVIFLAALFFAGSRGVALSAFGVVAALVCLKLKTKFGPGVVLFTLLIIPVITGGYFATFFDPENLSNAAKLGHIHSYAVEFDDHPSYLLWGQGTDTEFYSEGFQRKLNETELTYLDMIRWFGIPVTALMLIALLYPAFRLARQANGMSYLVVPYVAYLLGAATNPLLICSFGALIVSAVWGAVLCAPPNNPSHGSPALS